MDNSLRFNVTDERPRYCGKHDTYPFNENRIWEFNHRHDAILERYHLSLKSAEAVCLSDKLNSRSNLGALRNRKLRESAVLAAGLAAIAVGLHGRGSAAKLPKEERTKQMMNLLKRDNDRTAALAMAEVLQTTSMTLPVGEEVVIESTITEGVRVKPGKELGGNPTIAVGALFGKEEHRHIYGLPMKHNVSLLSMGNDVIDGTTKSVKGEHSSLTALFLTESNVKRHLPDVYIQRWMSGSYFDLFNPRSVPLEEQAEIIAKSYNDGTKLENLSAFFLDRNRHHYAMDKLNKAGVATPWDKDGDLFPSLVLGNDLVDFPNGRKLNSFIGEIGGSAEWAVGVLPLVWRGGQAIGMMTSQSALTRKDLSPEQKWKERFHFTEEEFMAIQDARFEHKPYFTIFDILEEPFAGGIACFGGITDNMFLPEMEGVSSSAADNTVTVNVLSTNSLGLTELWKLTFACTDGLEKTVDAFLPPKQRLINLKGKDLESAIGRVLDDPVLRERYRIFFNNEYYPALIPVREKMVLLHRAIEGLIARGALADIDREIVETTLKLASEWFVND
ncbi:fructose-bisphosphatase class II [candidate division GN15 bacterium]|nr:fructose-bisphosphatase class II [candidate division GN15 bacterium]